MARKDPDVLQILSSFEASVRQEISHAVDRARSVGRGGDLDQSQCIVDHALRQFLPDRIMELDSMRRQYNVDTQLARANINQKGRVIGHVLGRGSFATAVRGGMARGRDMNRVRLAQEEASVRNEFDRVRRALVDLQKHLHEEIRLIRAQRASTR